MSYHLSVDVEATAQCYHLLSVLGCHINLHSVSHVKHLIHLAPLSAALLLNESEKRRYGEHIVLHHSTVIIYEV